MPNDKEIKYLGVRKGGGPDRENWARCLALIYPIRRPRLQVLPLVEKRPVAACLLFPLLDIPGVRIAPYVVAVERG